MEYLTSLSIKNNQTIQQFHFNHDGGNILITDVLSNHQEVIEKFNSHKISKFDHSSFVLKNMEPGKYETYLIETDMGKWGNRLSGIYFINSNYDQNKIIQDGENWKDLYDFGVDGGTCMFLSESALKHTVDLDVYLEKWMSCEYKGNFLKFVLDHKTIGFGTSTGFGDGVYYFFGYYDKHKLIGIKVFFVDDDSDSE